MRRPSLKFSRILVTGSMLVTLAVPAHAHNAIPRQDRSDNVVAFDYETSGEIVTQTSSRRWHRDDEVDFQVIVREGGDSGPGLKGTVRLRLVADHAKTYDGWFALKVTSGDELVYRSARPATIALRPEPGRRIAWLNFRFDLPAGSYEATATFDKS